MRFHHTPTEWSNHVPSDPMQDLRQDHLGRLRSARQPGQGRCPRQDWCNGQHTADEKAAAGTDGGFLSRLFGR